MSGRGPSFSKSTMVVSGLVVLIGLTIYPTIILPRMNPAYYREKQKVIRDKVSLEETQPGGMKVWSDPFGRKDSDKKS